MSIADNIEKEFTKRLLESRAEARRKLVSVAADKEDLIRAKRPRKKKDQESIIEEAHPGEVFVAESDGLGGRVGNPEQVQQQIVDALNRRPSAFPYQGLVANAMADFEKTAEVLESHDLYVEAEAVRKTAADWLAVLQRRGSLKSYANTPPPAPGMGSLGDAVPDVASSVPAVAAVPPAATNVVPAATEAASDVAGAASNATSSEEKANFISKSLTWIKGKFSTSTAVKSATKAAKPATGAFGKVMTALGWLGEAISLGSETLDRDWTSVTMKGGAALAAAGVAAIPGTGGASAILSAAGTALMVVGLVKDFLLESFQEDIDTDIKDLISGIDEQLEEISNNTDPDSVKERESLNKMKIAATQITASVQRIQGEARKAPADMDLHIIAASMESMDNSAKALLSEIDAVKGMTWFDLDVSYINTATKDVIESIQEFNENMAAKAPELTAKIKAARDSINASQEEREKIISGINSGSMSGREIREQTGSTVVTEQDTKDPEYIKDIQKALNASKIPEIQVEVTGKWDTATENSLELYTRMWHGVAPGLASVVTIDKLKQAGADEIKKLNRLYNDRSTFIAGVMSKTTNK